MTSLKSNQSLHQVDVHGTMQHDRRKENNSHAWLIVLASFLCHFVVGGIYYSFSLFYIDFVEYFQCDRQTAGWIGSAHISSIQLCTLVFSVIVTRYGCRIVAILGALVASIGLIWSSFVTSIIALYFTFGIIGGTGCGMIWLPTLIIVQRSFTFRRSLAAGISLSGFPLGSVAGAALQRLCLDTYGWRGTVLLMGAVVLHCCAFGMFYKTPSSNRVGFRQSSTQTERYCEPECHDLNEMNASSSPSLKVRRAVLWSTIKDIFDMSLLSEVPFILFCLGTFCMAVGMIAFSQHNPSRAVYKGVTVAEASLLPLVNGISDAVSRTASGLFGNMKSADRTMQYAVMILLGGVLEALFVFATKFAHFVVYTVLFGFLTGGFLGIQQTVQVDLFGLERIARSQALICLVVYVGCLLTTPFAGFLFDVTQDYDIPFYVTGSVQVLGGVLLVALAINNRRWGKPPDDVTDDVMET